MNKFQTRLLGIVLSASLAGLVVDAAAQNDGGAGLPPGARMMTAPSEAEGGFAVKDAAGLPGTVIPLEIRLPASLGSRSASRSIYTFLMFKGIPEGFSLSEGFHTRNTWIVSIRDSADLKMTVPKAFRGAFSADLYLYRGEHLAPFRSTFQVHIADTADTLPTSADHATVPSEMERQPATVLSADERRLSREDEAKLFAQGEAHLRNGNVAFARLLFEELVSHGNVRGLYALARTYDPAVLRQLGAVGLRGDPEKAKELYRRATEFAGAPPPEQSGAQER